MMLETGVRSTMRAMCRCRTVGCSRPEAAPMTENARQWRMSRQSHAAFRQRMYSVFSYSQIGGKLLMSCFSALGLQ